MNQDEGGQEEKRTEGEEAEESDRSDNGEPRHEQGRARSVETKGVAGRRRRISNLVGEDCFHSGLKLKRNEETAIRKPAKWRGPIKGSPIYLFFFRRRARGETEARRESWDKSNKYISAMSIKLLTAVRGAARSARNKAFVLLRGREDVKISL